MFRVPYFRVDGEKYLWHGGCIVQGACHPETLALGPGVHLVPLGPCVLLENKGVFQKQIAYGILEICRKSLGC